MNQKNEKPLEVSADLVFRDPYLLDLLGLSDTYSEKDLESAIIVELQRFIIELLLTGKSGSPIYGVSQINRVIDRPESPLYCHSERSEESPRGCCLLERFFASLRMTNVTRSITQPSLDIGHCGLRLSTESLVCAWCSG